MRDRVNIAVDFVGERKVCLSMLVQPLTVQYTKTVLLLKKGIGLGVLITIGSREIYISTKCW